MVGCRIINSKEKLLNLLGITNKYWIVHSNSYNKYRQIDKFIEVIDSLLKESNLLNKNKLEIIDFGSGKSYLTFALYCYLEKDLGIDTRITGIEQRTELVEFCSE